MNAFGITDKGKVRSQNQDSFRLKLAPNENSGIVVLCDGMGGERSGEVASAIAVDNFISYAEECLSSPHGRDAAQIARESASYANLQVYDRAFRDLNCTGMGTTLVGIIVCGGETAIVNVGDSRCYWLAENQIQQITRDHSFVQELVDSGTITPGEARSHPRKNLITRALGLERRIRTDVFRIEPLTGDILLLCSDGLSNVVGEEEIAAAVGESTDLAAGCEKLLTLALDRGAPDNVTVVLMEC